jgi:hypothetical protein
LIIDNKTNGKVGDALAANITPQSKFSCVSGAFSIFGFEALREDLLKLENSRFIITQLKDLKSVDQKSTVSFLGDKFEVRLRNQLGQAKIALECAAWIRSSAQVKTAKQVGTLNQTLFHIQNPETDSFAIQGSSQFTSSGLGFSESANFDINMGVTDAVNIHALGDWFNAIWNNDSAVEDAKEIFLSQLELLHKDQAPQFIYFLTLFNLFKDYLEDLNEEKIIRSKTGFKDTLVWSKLYKFQKTVS